LIENCGEIQSPEYISLKPFRWFMSD